MECGSGCRVSVGARQLQQTRDNRVRCVINMVKLLIINNNMAKLVIIFSYLITSIIRDVRDKYKKRAVLLDRARLAERFPKRSVTVMQCNEIYSIFYS